MNSLLDVESLCTLLGLAKITIYKYVSEKKIPYVKIGRRVMFRPDEIESWIKSKTVEPIGGAL